MNSIQILAQSSNCVAVEKPPGTLVIPGRGKDQSVSLREQLEALLKGKVFVVHRLDQHTSGVVLFALNPETHRVLSMGFEAGIIRKLYLALVEGRLSEPREYREPLSPARRGRMKVARRGQGKAARTRVRPVESFARATLVEAEPLTGRTHQIRLHLAHAGYPLLYDAQYGRRTPVTALDLGGQSDEVVVTRTPLHACRIELPLGIRVGFQSIDSPLPSDMVRALEILRGSA